MMVSELLSQIADMLLAGAGVDAIEETIIDPAPLDEEQKSVLWLYAQALQEQRRARASCCSLTALAYS